MIYKLFILILSIVLLNNSALCQESKILYLTLNSTGDKLFVEAKLDDEIKSFTLNENTKATQKNFKSLLKRLNEWNLTKDYLEKRIGHYEQTLFQKVSAMLDKSSQVHFILDKGSFYFALDIIPYKGEPLFLQYPTSFSIKPVSVIEKYNFNFSGKGLTIKDKTTDPEKASLQLSKLLPNTIHYEMENISKANLQQKSSLDIALISLHGIASDDIAYMQLNDEEIYSQDLLGLNSKMLYLDSCQMGSSYDFTKQLSKSANQFIIAPLFDNEAGDSSTLTIHTFFTKLSKNNTPADALYHTRKSLFKTYNEKFGFETAIWKAYPFRVIQNS